MATNPIQSNIQDFYLEKKRVDIVECICQCRAQQAKNEKYQFARDICDKATFLQTRSFDSGDR